MAAASSYRRNARTGATPNPVMVDPDAVDAALADEVERVLETATELVRITVRSHHLSWSEKYASCADCAVPAQVRGVHEWLRHQHRVVLWTNEELEGHPAFRRFSQQGGHPPVHGWLAGHRLEAEHPRPRPGGRMSTADDPPSPPGDRCGAPGSRFGGLR